MKALVLFAALAVAASLAFASHASLRQGGFVGASRIVEQWPGPLRLHRRHGGNAATITRNGTGSSRIDQD